MVVIHNLSATGMLIELIETMSQRTVGQRITIALPNAPDLRPPPSFGKTRRSPAVVSTTLVAQDF